MRGSFLCYGDTDEAVSAAAGVTPALRLPSAPSHTGDSEGDCDGTKGAYRDPEVPGVTGAGQAAATGFGLRVSWYLAVWALSGPCRG